MINDVNHVDALLMLVLLLMVEELHHSFVKEEDVGLMDHLGGQSSLVLLLPMV